MISKVSSVSETVRPATAIVTKQTTDPRTQEAARGRSDGGAVAAVASDAVIASAFGRLVRALGLELRRSTSLGI